MLKAGDKVRVLKNEYDEDKISGMTFFEGLEGTVLESLFVEQGRQLVLVDVPDKPCMFDSGWALFDSELEVI